MAALDGSRVQAPDTPDASQLQPTDLSSLSFYAAPAHAPEDDRLGQLAQSLGAFGEGVRQFGHAYSVAQRPHALAQQKADQTAADQFRATHTDAEYLKAIKDGTAPRFQDGMAQEAMDTNEGQIYAHNLANDLSTKVGAGELSWSNGSAMKYLDDQRQQIAQQNGWSPTSGQALGFGRAFNTVYQNAQVQAGKAQVQVNNDRASQTAFDQIEMEMDAAAKQHMSPEQTWTGINSVRKGLVETLHFEPRELDPIIFGALQRRMSGPGADPSWVMAVGNAQRSDLDGKTPIPSLFSKAQWADQVTSMSQRARQFNADANDAAQKTAVTTGVGQLLNGPNPERIAGVPETIPYTNAVTGAQGQVSKAVALKAAVNARLDADNRRVASGQATPDQVMDEQLGSFAKAGVRNDQWADALNNAAQGGANLNSLTDPKQQGSMVSAYQLYANLRAKNPAYLGTLVSGKTSAFYEDAYLQQTLFNKSPLEAMQAASTINAEPKNEQEAASMAGLRKQAESTAAGLSWGSGWFGANPVHNPEMLKSMVERGATSLMRLNGLSAPDAVKLAGEAAQEHFVNVNGYLVPDLHYLPKDQMEPAAQKYLADWASGPAKALNLDPKSLSLSPVGTGKFLIVDTASGTAVTHGNGMSYVTPRDLIQASKSIRADALQVQQQRTDEAAGKAASGIRENQQLLRDGPPLLVGP